MVNIQKTRDELGTESSTQTLFPRFSQKVAVETPLIVIESREISEDHLFILDHPTQGILDEDPLGDSFQDPELLEIIGDYATNALDSGSVQLLDSNQQILLVRT